MNKVILKVQYILDHKNMTDDEYYKQDFLTFDITEEMIKDLVETLKPEQSIDRTNFFVMKTP